MSLHPELWHGESAVRLTSPAISLIVLPGRGAKIASLRDRDGHEWLARPAPGNLTPAKPGDRFATAEMCGWDEIASNISADVSPDHGEVWAMPWTVLQADATMLEMEAAGRDFRIVRRITLLHDGFTLDYRATSTAGGIEFLWAAHPQFTAPTGTTVNMPDRIRRMSGISAGIPQNFARKSTDVDPFNGLGTGSGRKLWCLPADALETVTIRHPAGQTLTMSWDPTQIPYFALWTDNQWRSREPVVALEPGTVYGDDPAAAAAEGLAMRLHKQQRKTWTIHVRLDSGEPTPPRGA